MLKRFAVSSAFFLLATSAGFCADGNEGHVQLNVDVTAQSLSGSDLEALEHFQQILNQQIDSWRQFQATPERQAYEAFLERYGIDDHFMEAEDVYAREDYEAAMAYERVVETYGAEWDKLRDERLALWNTHPHLKQQFREMDREGARIEKKN